MWIVISGMEQADTQAVEQLSSSMYGKKQRKLADRKSGLKSENRRKWRYKTISPGEKPEMAAWFQSIWEAQLHFCFWVL